MIFFNTYFRLNSERLEVYLLILLWCLFKSKHWWGRMNYKTFGKCWKRERWNNSKITGALWRELFVEDVEQDVSHEEENKNLKLVEIMKIIIKKVNNLFDDVKDLENMALQTRLCLNEWKSVILDTEEVVIWLIQYTQRHKNKYNEMLIYSILKMKYFA